MHLEFFKANDGRRVQLVEYYGEGPDGAGFKYYNPSPSGTLRFTDCKDGAYIAAVNLDNSFRSLSFYSPRREGRPCEGGFLWEYENKPGDIRVACRFEFLETDRRAE